MNFRYLNFNNDSYQIRLCNITNFLLLQVVIYAPWKVLQSISQGYIQNVTKCGNGRGIPSSLRIQCGTTMPH